MRQVGKLQSVTLQELERFAELEERRKQADREARNLGKEIAQLRRKFEAAMQADGKQAATRYGFRLVFVEGRPRVAWKDEFIRIAGSESADQLMADAPRPAKLEVTAPE